MPTCFASGTVESLAGKLAGMPKLAGLEESAARFSRGEYPAVLRPQLADGRRQGDLPVRHPLCAQARRPPGPSLFPMPAAALRGLIPGEPTAA